MRAIVGMDQEPLHFMQVFQGSLCVTTGVYNTRKPQQFTDDPEDDESLVMLF